MARDIATDREVENVRDESDRAPGGDGAPGSAREVAAEPLDRADGRPEDRAAHRQRISLRQRTITLRDSEREFLRTVGTFRAVAVVDLERLGYHGRRSRLDADLQSLVGQRLIQRVNAHHRTGSDLTVVVLSKEGRALASRAASSPDQVFYSGLVKAKELEHDTALYRLYEAEAGRLERGGGTVHRVILDAELKGQLAAAVNRAAHGPAEDAAERQAAAARMCGLRVVDGTVQIPDLRIEYETHEGDRTRVDLELATEHYKPAQVAAKARAGFTIYASASQTARLSAALEERGIVADILSL